MADDVAIRVDSVSKTFKLPHEKNTSVKGAVVNFYHRNRTFEKQEALKDISFEVKKGEFFGIVGRNGSGKSTLLKMLAGIYSPSQGNITVNGKLTPFIELGVGFNPELTGRENVYLNGALLGFSRKEMRKMYRDIVEFAELRKFMDQKLKNYSSGMQVRLAFSIAIRAESAILLLDEVLAVGDALFQKKCYDYFKKLKKDKRTVVFVSHDTNALLEYCDRGVLVNDGQIVEKGDINTIVNDYIDTLNKAEAKEKIGTNKVRWGTGETLVDSIDILEAKSLNEKTLFSDTDKELIVKVLFKAQEDTDNPVFGITITDASGARVFASNTLWAKHETKDLKKGQKITVEWQIPNVFNNGTFSIAPAVADRTGAVIYDWLEEATKFKVSKSVKSTAFINVDHKVVIHE